MGWPQKRGQQLHERVCVPSMLVPALDVKSLLYLGSSLFEVEC